MKLPDEELLKPGTMFSRYEVVKLLGAGGMGAVYEARHLDLDKRVAVKVLHRALATDAQMFQRFLREGRAASKIHHPNVVDVSDVGTVEGRPYLVMEFLEGEDLGSLLAHQGKLSIEKIAGTLLPVIAALASAHDEGIVHRDLKPENIFLARSRNGGMEPKILDFGISKLGGPESMQITNSQAVLGTPCYMSPEQAQRSSQSDARSDIYSMGVILYECATGKLPIKGESLYEVLLAIASGEVDPPRMLEPSLPVAFEELILRAMKHKAHERYATAHDLGRALLAFASAGDHARWESVFAAGRHSSVRPPRQLVETAETVLSGGNPARASKTADPAAFSTVAQTGVVTGVPRPTASGSRRALALGASALVVIAAFVTWRVSATRGVAHPALRPPPAAVVSAPVTHVTTAEHSGSAVPSSSPSPPVLVAPPPPASVTPPVLSNPHAQDTAHGAHVSAPVRSQPPRTHATPHAPTTAGQAATPPTPPPSAPAQTGRYLVE